MPRSEPPDFWKGVAYAFSSSAIFGVMGFFVHIAPREISGPRLLFLRSVFTCLCLTPFVGRGFVERLLSRRAVSIWMRSVAGGTSALCFFMNLRLTHVGDANILADSSILIVVILSWFLYRERLRMRQYIAILIIGLGDWLLTRPEASHLSMTSLALGLVGGCAGAVAYLSLKSATVHFKRAEIVWLASLVSALLALGLAWELEAEPFSRVTLLSGAGYFSLGMVCISGLLGQILLTQGFILLRASIATAIGISSAIWGALLELYYVESSIALGSWVGYGVVIIGLQILVFGKQGRIPRT